MSGTFLPARYNRAIGFAAAKESAVFRKQMEYKLTKVRFLGLQVCYYRFKSKVDCKSEGNILGVKKWL